MGFFFLKSEISVTILFFYKFFYIVLEIFMTDLPKIFIRIIRNMHYSMQESVRFWFQTKFPLYRQISHKLVN